MNALMIDPRLIEAAAEALANLRGWSEDPRPAVQDYDIEQARAVLEVVIPLTT